MTSVKGDYPDHVMNLLGLALQALRDDLERPGPLRDLRWSQIRLLTLTPADGMRITDLAARVGMTKQALGEFATVLEHRGLLESVRDPADRRLRIVRPTAAGLAAAAAGEAVIAEAERRWRERIGPHRWDALRGTLIAIREAGGH